MAQNTNPARGMRDFLPADVRRREYVISVIKEVYQKYGFEPLETPAVENIETLMGKYGEEGNQLIFKILKRGEGASTGEADLALRYDLTVPTARVVAQYKNDLPKFFKRYQIQPVWRADRPARGRYREFYQCDVDVFGTKSMLVEVELCAAVSEVLHRLGFNDFVIRINHRKVLIGILDAAGVPTEKHTDALVALDKIDKIGREGVAKEFSERGITNDAGNKLLNLFESVVDEELERVMSELSSQKYIELQKNISEIQQWREDYQQSELSLQKIARHVGTNILTLDKLSSFVDDNKIGQEGIEDLNIFFKLNKRSENALKIRIDPSLARGLSYYTGAIFEIAVPDLAGSLGGGGRYDGLIGMFSGQEIPACGFSLGLERIIVVMTERGMFPEHLTATPADVLVTIWNENSFDDSLIIAKELRAQGLRVLVYPEADKLGKQFKYAASLNIPAVAVLGDEERANHTVTVKYLETGNQETISRDRLATDLKL